MMLISLSEVMMMTMAMMVGVYSGHGSESKCLKRRILSGHVVSHRRRETGTRHEASCFGGVIP